jgi:TPR repeat protein
LLLLSSVAALAGHLEAEKALRAGKYARAKSEYERLAEQGDAKAQAQLGLMYARGQGVATNRGKAAELLRRAAEQGDAEGAFGLGMVYDNGDISSPDKAQAAKWYRLAADKNHPRAAYMLAGMLLKGDGIAKSPDEGMDYMNRARQGREMDAILYQRNLLDTAGDQLKLRFEGGFGDTPETAVRISGPANKQDGVPAQRKFIELLYPGWQNYKQSLLPLGNKHFDAFEMTGPNGEKQIIYFDVTHWYK